MTVKKNKKTNKWETDFYCGNKRIRNRGFNRRVDAEKYKAKILNDWMYKKHLLPKEEKIKFIDLAGRYLKNYSKPNKRSWKTDIALMKPLVGFFGLTNIGNITREDIDIYRKERIQAKIRKGKKYPEGKLISKTTVNRELTLLRATLNKAIEWNLLYSNPASILRLTKEEPKERILSEPDCAGI